MNHPSIESAAKPELEYPFGLRWSPEPGQPFEVARGVFWLRMPLPIALDHINLWILKDHDGWVIVDTGYDAPSCKHVWQEVFDGFLNPADVNRIIVTHFHPDHIGLASWLARACGDCPVLISHGEFAHYQTIINRQADVAHEQASAFISEMGYPPNMVEKFAAFMVNDDKPDHTRLQPAACQFIKEGDQLQINGQTWHIISGNGHSPEHSCIYNPELNLMLSGDQSIARISSNVSVYPSNRDKDPLGDWLDSCQKLIDRLPADTMMLPAHQEPFIGNHARMQQLIDEHHRQLNRLRKQIDRPLSPVDARSILFDRELNTIETLLATGETLAHLNYLMHRGELSMQLDEQGIARYQSKSSQT